MPGEVTHLERCKQQTQDKATQKLLKQHELRKFEKVGVKKGSAAYHEGGIHS